MPYGLISPLLPAIYLLPRLVLEPIECELEKSAQPYANIHMCSVHDLLDELLAMLMVEGCCIMVMGLGFKGLLAIL